MKGTISGLIASFQGVGSGGTIQAVLGHQSPSFVSHVTPLYNL